MTLYRGFFYVIIYVKLGKYTAFVFSKPYTHLLFKMNVCIAGNLLKKSSWIILTFCLKHYVVNSKDISHY